MSGFFKGIIDDGAPLRFDPPAVYQRLHNDGLIENYRKRPAFGAFRVMVERLSDSRFVRTLSAGNDETYVFEFEKEGRPFWVAWTKNGRQADLGAAVSDYRIDKTVDRDGNEASLESPIVLTEKPLYLYPALRSPQPR
jgi:hypothetical protein